jgi:hypothetical protein
VEISNPAFILDSRFHGNDKIASYLTFYTSSVIGILVNSANLYLQLTLMLDKTLVIIINKIEISINKTYLFQYLDLFLSNKIFFNIFLA